MQENSSVKKFFPQQYSSIETRELCAYSFICNNNPGQNTFFQSSVPFVTDRKLLVAFEINELCHKTIMHTSYSFPRFSPGHIFFQLIVINTMRLRELRTRWQLQIRQKPETQKKMLSVYMHTPNYVYQKITNHFWCYFDRCNQKLESLC